MFANLISLNSFIDKISLITKIVSYIVLRSYLSIALLTLCKVLFFNEETTTSKLLPVIETMTTSPKSSLIVYLTRFLPAPFVESEETFIIQLIDKKELKIEEIVALLKDKSKDNSVPERGFSFNLSKTILLFISLANDWFFPNSFLFICFTYNTVLFYTN